MNIGNTGALTLNSTLLGSNLELRVTGLKCAGTCNRIGATNNATGARTFTGVTFAEPAT